MVIPSTRTLLREGEPAALEPKAFDILLHLIEHRDRVVTKAELLEAFWKDLVVVENAVGQYIYKIRQTIDERHGDSAIQTVRGRGFRFVSEVSLESSSDKFSEPECLVVLPFLNLSTESDGKLIAVGVTELITMRLAALRNIRVISRTTAMQFQDTPLSLAEIGQTLGTRWAVEGSVLKSSDQVQIVVQLIDTNTDSHRWAESFTRDLTQLLTVQNEIAQAVATRVGHELSTNQGEAWRPEISSDAMVDYLRARHHMSRRTSQSLATARKNLARVLRVEPTFASALAALADTHIMEGIYGFVPETVAYPTAEGFALKALDLDPSSFEAHTALSAIAFFHGWDPGAAESHVRKALQHNPSYGLARLLLADSLIVQGKANAAMAEIHGALRVNPLDLGLNMNVGDLLILQRDYRAAITQLQNTLELDPSFTPARLRLALAYALAGESELAQQGLGAEQPDDPKFCEYAALVYGLGNHKNKGSRWLRQLELLAQQRHVAPWSIARAAAVCGDADKVFLMLDAAIDSRSSSVIFLRASPIFDQLRDDPRMNECYRRIGLAP